jgi:hypothetical protein
LASRLPLRGTERKRTPRPKCHNRPANGRPLGTYQDGPNTVSNRQSNTSYFRCLPTAALPSVCKGVLPLLPPPKRTSPLPCAKNAPVAIVPAIRGHYGPL